MLESTRARTLVAAALVGALVALQIASPVLGAWLRSAALFTEVVLQPPVRPLVLLSPEPRREEMRWAGGGHGVLTLPGGRGPHPGIVLVLGANPAPPDDPRVRRLTDSLARVGLAVLLTQSEALDEKRIVPDEIDRLVAAFDQLVAHEAVERNRIGFVGLSAGGSLAIVAASQPSVAEQAWMVLAIGPYFDARNLVAATTSETFRRPDGTLERWDPERTTRLVVRESLLDTLTASERDALNGGRAVSDDAAIVSDLLDGTDRERAEALLDQLSPRSLERLRAVSPSHTIDGLRAPLYLLHDRADRFVPWPESERLAARYPPTVYHRTDVFEHVEPRLGSLRPLVRDAWRLLRLFTRILLDAR